MLAALGRAPLIHTALKPKDASTSLAYDVLTANTTAEIFADVR